MHLICDAIGKKGLIIPEFWYFVITGNFEFQPIKATLWINFLAGGISRIKLTDKYSFKSNPEAKKLSRNCKTLFKVYVAGKFIRKTYK